MKLNICILSSPYSKDMGRRLQWTVTEPIKTRWFDRVCSHDSMKISLIFYLLVAFYLKNAFVFFSKRSQHNLLLVSNKAMRDYDNLFKILILEREEEQGERERKRKWEKHLFIVLLMCAFIGWLLCVPLLRTEPTTLVNGDDALTNWATWPGLMRTLKAES